MQNLQNLHKILFNVQQYMVKLIILECLLNFFKKGKIIISEVGVPYEEKSVKPVEMGGFAGGLFLQKDYINYFGFISF